MMVLEYLNDRQNIPNCQLKDVEIFQYHHGMWNCYIMLESISADNPWMAISNLELRQS